MPSITKLIKEYIPQVHMDDEPATYAEFKRACQDIVCPSYMTMGSRTGNRLFPHHTCFGTPDLGEFGQ